jgi:hypothetical protein
LIINDARALVHTVADTAYLISPGVFQRYAREYPQTAVLAKQDQVADWQWVQKRFEKLHLHRKQDNGLNIWTCEVTGSRKTRCVHGYLLDNPKCLFDDLPANNPYLSSIHSGSMNGMAGRVHQRASDIVDFALPRQAPRAWLRGRRHTPAG